MVTPEGSIVVKPIETLAEADGRGYVHYQSWQESYAGLISAEYLKNHTLEKCVSYARQWTDGTLIAKDGDRVVGFACYGAYRDGALPGVGEVYALYVLREYHGQQVGLRLMQAALDKLAGYDAVALWALKGNDRAIRFYQKLGFQFDGAEEPLNLGGPATELRMRMFRAGNPS